MEGLIQELTTYITVAVGMGSEYLSTAAVSELWSRLYKFLPIIWTHRIPHKTWQQRSPGAHTDVHLKKK